MIWTWYATLGKPLDAVDASDASEDDGADAEDISACTVTAHRSVRKQTQFHCEWDPSWLHKSELKSYKKDIKLVSQDTRTVDNKVETLIQWLPTWETDSTVRRTTIEDYSGPLVPKTVFLYLAKLLPFCVFLILGYFV